MRCYTVTTSFTAAAWNEGICTYKPVVDIKRNVLRAGVRWHAVIQTSWYPDPPLWDGRWWGWGTFECYWYRYDLLREWIIESASDTSKAWANVHAIWTRWKQSSRSWSPSLSTQALLVSFHAWSIQSSLDRDDKHRLLGTNILTLNHHWPYAVFKRMWQSALNNKMITGNCIYL